MSTRSSGRGTPVDYGVQFHFNDLYDSGGGQPLPQPKLKPQTTSKYGVAVRVQGIAGQPYVVLKDGQRGDSYGVQLKTQGYSSSYSSLPRRTEKAEVGAEGADVGGVGGQLGALRRAQSHGSLLDRDEGVSSDDFQLSRPPGDGKSGSYGNLDGGIGVRREREVVSSRERVAESSMRDSSHQAVSNRSLESVRNNHSYPDPRQQANEPPPYQRQTPVNRLINRYDGVTPGSQQRGLLPAQQHPRATSPLLHPKPYNSPPPSAHSSLGHGHIPGSKVPGLSANQWGFEEPRRVDPSDSQVTPDLLLDQVECAEMSFEEEQVMKTVYNILRQGSVCFSKQPKENPWEEWIGEKRELETKVAQLQTALREERRVSRAQRLTQLRMDRENAETRLREMEDHLAELQDEVRRENGSKTVQQPHCGGGVGQIKMLSLTHNLVFFCSLLKSHAGIEAERLRVNTSVRTLQQQLEDCRDESTHWMEQFHTARDELRSTKQDEAQREASQLKGKLSVTEEELETAKTGLSKAQMDVNALQDAQRDQEASNTRLKEKLSRLELQSNATESSEAELALQTEVRSLRSELDEAKRKASRLSQEHRELGLRLESTERDRETLKQTISQLEDTKRQQEKAMEKLNKEVRRADFTVYPHSSKGNC
ncbi:hypothetical protein XENOCAPTIV_001913, partial [Xenoophorus captivus]